MKVRKNSIHPQELEQLITVIRPVYRFIKKETIYSGFSPKDYEPNPNGSLYFIEVFPTRFNMLANANLTPIDPELESTKYLKPFKDIITIHTTKTYQDIVYANCFDVLEQIPEEFIDQVHAFEARSYKGHPEMFKNIGKQNFEEKSFITTAYSITTRLFKKG